MPSCRVFSGKLWVLLASVVILAAPMLGQTFFGSIVGTVSDSAGGVMPGVAVTLTNNGTGAVQTGTTSADGNYRFVNLVPGSYRVDAEQVRRGPSAGVPIALRAPQPQLAVARQHPG